jgi:hypothetical protein
MAGEKADWRYQVLSSAVFSSSVSLCLTRQVICRLLTNVLQVG